MISNLKDFFQKVINICQIYKYQILYRYLPIFYQLIYLKKKL